jgi:NAD(P)-dependent dehydrogenase (short-subunit alcohol dehydrogenase family)
MKIDLSGKSALVTGSTAGIGYAIAKGLVAAGAKVFVNGRSEGRVQEAVKRLRAEVPSADINGVAADVGSEKGAEALYGQVKEVDILINNAGIYEPKPFFEIPDADWQRFFDVNVMSGVRLSRHYTRQMVEKRWGRVLFISSESGVQTPVEMVHYGMTKSAMLAVSRGLAETVAATGVTVNAVLPGPTKSEGVTDFVRAMNAGTSKSFEQAEQDFFRTVRPSSLIKRFATAEEVANMVVYLSSKEASATTGAALRVDGGVIPTLT